MRKESLYKIFSNIPTLKSERISLRAMHPIDAEDMFDYAHREDVTRYLLWSPHTSLAYTKDYLRYIQNRYALGDFYVWAVIDLESRRMIGTCGFARIDTVNNPRSLGTCSTLIFITRGLRAKRRKGCLSLALRSLDFTVYPQDL